MVHGRKCMIMCRICTRADDASAEGRTGVTRIDLIRALPALHWCARTPRRQIQRALILHCTYISLACLTFARCSIVCFGSGAVGRITCSSAVFSAGSLLVRRRSQPVGAINTRRFGSALPRLFGIDCASSCSPDHQASAATGQASFRHGFRYGQGALGWPSRTRRLAASRFSQSQENSLNLVPLRCAALTLWARFAVDV